MQAAKRVTSLAMCFAFLALVSFMLATYGEPINSALWRDVLWGL